MEQRIHTRRGAIGRMLAVAVGAAGAGALTESKASSAAKAAPGRNLTLFAPFMHQKPVGRDARLLPFGELVDAKGRHLGDFHSAAVDSTAGALTMHTFALADGTILGLGAASGTYAVVGGTGAFAGMTGSYLAGADRFTFTFSEDAHGRS